MYSISDVSMLFHLSEGKFLPVSSYFILWDVDLLHSVRKRKHNLEILFICYILLFSRISIKFWIKNQSNILKKLIL
jgi:hypothetical protein